MNPLLSKGIQIISHDFRRKAKDRQGVKVFEGNACVKERENVKKRRKTVQFTKYNWAILPLLLVPVSHLLYDYSV